MRRRLGNDTAVAARGGGLVSFLRGGVKRLGVEKGEKGSTLFPNPAYIRRLTDKSWRARTVSPAPPIFISACPKPTNISLYSLVLVPTNII
jgi:hypothetical protein